MRFVLYGCETWSLISRKERRLKVCRGQDVEEICEPKRDEVTGERRKLHNMELHDFYFSLNSLWVIKSRRMRWAGHVACTGELRGAYRVLVGRPEGTRTLGGPRRRWEDNIKMYIKELELAVDWIDLAQNRDRMRALVYKVMNLGVR